MVQWSGHVGPLLETNKIAEALVLLNWAGSYWERGWMPLRPGVSTFNDTHVTTILYAAVRGEPSERSCLSAAARTVARRSPSGFVLP